MNKTDLQTLLQHPHLWRASDAPTTRGQHLGSHRSSDDSRFSSSGFNSSHCTTSSGYVLLDELLHSGNTQGGWPHSSSCELLSHQAGIGELRLLMPSLVQANSENRWITWIAPPFIPYAPALSIYGIDLGKLLVIHSKTLKDSLWAAEQCLQSGTCSAVLAWPEGANYKQLRRLQVAAKAGKSRGFFFRSAQAAQHASPAPLRIRIARKTTFILKVIKRPGSWASHTIHIPLIDDDNLTQTTTLAQTELSQSRSKTNIPKAQAETETKTKTKEKTDITLSEGGSHAVDVPLLS